MCNLKGVTTRLNVKSFHPGIFIDHLIFQEI